MGLFDPVKALFKKAEPNTEEYRQYKRCLESNAEDVKRFKGCVKEFTRKLDELKRHHTPDISSEYHSTLNNLNRFKYCLYEAERASAYIRENNADDIDYRTNCLPQFPNELNRLLPANSPLRFHGTPIYFAEDILKSGFITSSAERFNGYIKSTDQRGEISVSDLNSLSRTTDFFLHSSAYQRCLPCGCLFVLDGSKQTEEQRLASVMNCVNFKQDPTLLYAVVTTPENTQRVQKWLSDAGLSPSLAYTFDSFVSTIEQAISQNTNYRRPLANIIADAVDAYSSYRGQTPDISVSRRSRPVNER